MNKCGLKGNVFLKGVFCINVLVHCVLINISLIMDQLGSLTFSSC